MRELSKQCNLRPMKPFLISALAAALMAACGGGVRDDIARGQQVFSQDCAACHSVSSGVVIVGPSLAGISTRAAANDENLLPREVLRRSILSPQSEIVEGFKNMMPPDFEQKLVEADLEALLSYLMTLE